MSIALGLALSPVFGGGVGWQTSGASLDVDFANNRIFGGSSIASALAITRASAGYAQRLDGTWQSFASGALRMTDKGLLVEESRTNLFLNSLAPATQTITVVNGTVYTVSLFATGGTLTLSGAGSGTVNANDYVSFTASGTSLTVTCNSLTGSFQCVNVEAGARGTSPIETAGSSATRAADAVSVNNSSTFVAADAGGAFLKVRPRVVSGGGTRTFMAVIVNGTNRQSTYINASSGTFNFTTLTANVSQYFLSSTSGMSVETAYKTAMRWQANNAALRVPAALTSPANNTSNSQPSGAPTIWLGSLGGSSVFANGYIERVAFFLTPPSDSVLDALVA